MKVVVSALVLAMALLSSNIRALSAFRSLAPLHGRAHYYGLRFDQRRPSSPARSASSMRSSVSGEIWSAREEGGVELTLFTREGCTLCDKVVERLRELRFPNGEDELSFALKAVDITDKENRAWFGKYKYDIPVIHYNGQYWFKHRIPFDGDIGKVRLEIERGGAVEAVGQEPNAEEMERT